MGCGKRNFGKEWIHIDLVDLPHIDCKDIFNFPYDELELIYASHLIEYFDRTEVVGLLNYWKSKLKVNGILRLAVPNFEVISSLYNQNKYDLDSFLGPLYGRMDLNGKYIFHKTTYDFKSIKRLLEDVGFKEIRYWNHFEVDHGKYDDHSQAYLPHMDKENGTLISLNVECKK